MERGRWKCGKCDVEHGWPFDLAVDGPDPWPHARVHEPNAALRMEGDFLSEDFCVLEGKYFLVRSVLTIPVIGVSGDFGFGCWGTLSRENFEKYLAGFDTGDHADMGPWTGWLCNRLQGFTPGPDPIAVWVQPRRDRQRPLLWVRDDDHPLAIAQENGISAERMLELFSAYGHGPA